MNLESVAIASMQSPQPALELAQATFGERSQAILKMDLTDPLQLASAVSVAGARGMSNNEIKKIQTICLLACEEERKQALDEHFFASGSYATRFSRMLANAITLEMSPGVIRVMLLRLAAYSRIKNTVAEGYLATGRLLQVPREETESFISMLDFEEAEVEDERRVYVNAGYIRRKDRVEIIENPNGTFDISWASGDNQPSLILSIELLLALNPELTLR